LLIFQIFHQKQDIGSFSLHFADIFGNLARGLLDIIYLFDKIVGAVYKAFQNFGDGFAKSESPCYSPLVLPWASPSFCE
jgi:hypothetical protein